MTRGVDEQLPNCSRLTAGSACDHGAGWFMLGAAPVECPPTLPGAGSVMAGSAVEQDSSSSGTSMWSGHAASSAGIRCAQPGCGQRRYRVWCLMGFGQISQGGRVTIWP